jgi:hypothetical protein
MWAVFAWLKALSASRSSMTPHPNLPLKGGGEEGGASSEAHSTGQPWVKPGNDRWALIDVPF